MSIHYTMNVVGDTLEVNASGFDDSLEEVQQYGMAIIAACLRNNIVRIFCNELELEYRLDTFDTYRAAEFITANAPRVAKIAIACKPKHLEDALFFETVAVNRGLTVRVFKDAASATHWLKHPEAAAGLSS